MALHLPGFTHDHSHADLVGRVVVVSVETVAIVDGLGGAAAPVAIAGRPHPPSPSPVFDGSPSGRGEKSLFAPRIGSPSP